MLMRCSKLQFNVKNNFLAPLWTDRIDFSLLPELPVVGFNNGNFRFTGFSYD